MIIENTKTAILWILILASVVLTYLIWTYQPEYRVLLRDETDYIESEQIGEERTLASLLVPNEIIVHQEEGKYWLQSENNTYKDVLEEMRTVEIRNLHPIRPVRASVIERPFNGVEIIFPDRLHEEWLPKFFSFGEDPQNLSGIDRIVLFEDEDSNHGEVSVIFISTNEDLLYYADTSLSINRFRSIYNDDQFKLSKVETLELNDISSRFYAQKYVPVEWIELKNYTYLFNPRILGNIAEVYKRALFNDPEFVKHYFPGNYEEVFTDGNSMLSIIENGNILRFSDPVFISQNDKVERTVVDASIDFINGHSGWTGHFQLDEWQQSNMSDRVLYRMYIKGLPIMGTNTNDQEHFTIELMRTGNQITDYVRPIFQLEEEEFEVEMDILLPPYETVVEEINKDETIQLEWVEDIKIGHYMQKNEQVITFEPAWFVKERSRWKRIDIRTVDHMVEIKNREVGQGGLE